MDYGAVMMVVVAAVDSYAIVVKLCLCGSGCLAICKHGSMILPAASTEPSPRGSLVVLGGVKIEVSVGSVGRVGVLTTLDGMRGGGHPLAIPREGKVVGCMDPVAVTTSTSS